MEGGIADLFIRAERLNHALDFESLRLNLITHLE